MSRLLVLGNAGMDLAVVLPRLPRPAGETFAPSGEMMTDDPQNEDVLKGGRIWTHCQHRRCPS